MSKKSKNQEADASGDYPELAQTETQEHLELTTAEGQIINLEEETRKEGSAMKDKTNDANFICPKCHANLKLWANGKKRKFWICDSQQCAKGPFNSTIFIQGSPDIRLMWELSIGEMHPLIENKATQCSGERSFQ